MRDQGSQGPLTSSCACAQDFQRGSIDARVTPLRGRPKPAETLATHRATAAPALKLVTVRAVAHFDFDAATMKAPDRAAINRRTKVVFKGVRAGAR